MVSGVGTCLFQRGKAWRLATWSEVAADQVLLRVVWEALSRVDTPYLTKLSERLTSNPGGLSSLVTAILRKRP